MKGPGQNVRRGGGVLRSEIGLEDRASFPDRSAVVRHERPQQTAPEELERLGRPGRLRVPDLVERALLVHLERLVSGEVHRDAERSTGADDGRRLRARRWTRRACAGIHGRGETQHERGQRPGADVAHRLCSAPVTHTRRIMDPTSTEDSWDRCGGNRIRQEPRISMTDYADWTK